MDMKEEYGLTPYETREILFYKTDNGDVRVEILLYQENLWLTQAKMAELFEVQKAAISKHLKNIFESGELLEESVVSKMETTAADGKRYNTNYYNLDAIIAVGYRVNSRKATMFRIWANRVLKEFIIKGYVMDDARLREPENFFGKDYFEEQLERIRDIRSSERRFYQKITDIYSQCSADYDVNSPITKEFFATVQNKLHYAVTHHTAAEIVYGRADSTKPNMGFRISSSNGNFFGLYGGRYSKVNRRYLLSAFLSNCVCTISFVKPMFESRTERSQCFAFTENRTGSSVYPSAYNWLSNSLGEVAKVKQYSTSSRR